MEYIIINKSNQKIWVMVKLQSLPQINVVVKTKRNQFKQNNLQLVREGRQYKFR